MRLLTALGRPLVTERELTVEDVHAQHGTLLVRWTSRLAGPRADLEDLVQEVLLAVHRALPSFRGEALLTTWLYQLTRRVVMRSLRRERVRRWLFGTSDEDVDAASNELGPYASLELRRESRELYAALDQLSEKHRTAFLLFELEQLPAEEIARIMGTKPGTVWVWLHRARAKLRELLAEVER
ncbi:MAG: sigma-70 family RNA polymerase sigma factor [Myxococcaceae bacterium]|nr:sigma-70 family RNA polymerase sigma factor [Myxococcaceae bacterium]